MAIPINAKSFIVSHFLKKFKGKFSAPSSTVSPINPSSVSKIVTVICAPKAIVAPFHSNSSSSRQTHFNHPRSVFDKIYNLDDALKLFDGMIQRQPPPSVIKFNQLLQAVTKMKHYSCSIDLFKQMNVIRVPIDAYTINIVIKCGCQMYRTGEGFAVLGYGFKCAVVPNICIFNTIVNGLILEDRVPHAQRLFKKLITKKLFEPDAFMYNTMIKGLCKFGNNDTAISLLKLMDERGCKPDVFTYTTIIDSLNLLNITIFVCKRYLHL